MNKEDLLRLAKNPNFIPGIYNYCDQWCERCALVARCMNFALQKEHEKEAGTSGKKGEFWEQFEAIHRETQELLQRLAREHGVLLEPEAVTWGSSTEDPDSGAQPPPVVVAGEAYSEAVDEWFKSGEESLRAKEEEVLVQAKLGLAEVNEEVATLTDIVQILRWYQHQILVKLMRGITQKRSREDATQKTAVSEADGSIKVALIGMDRSVAAWLRMKECFPEKTDSILTLLVQLDRLRRSAERQFPDARSFIRPGFDEP